MKNSILGLLILLIFMACEPSKSDHINLGPLPEPPQFSLELDPDNPNKVIGKNLSAGYFNLLWIADGAQPQTSNRQVDSFFYSKAGTYKVILHGAKEGGSGTAFSMKEIVIENDATLVCDPVISLLTGDCGPEGKCWKFSTVAGAISVGPTYGSGDWYRSPQNGIVPVQLNSSWCFLFEGAVFDFRNNGQTIDPWGGYNPVPHTPTPGPWLLSKGTGMNGVDQLILTPGQFMGTWDSNNVLDIMLLTENELVVRTRLINQQRIPQSEGWFEFHFVAQ
jgi:hypothetical protein